MKFLLTLCFFLMQLFNQSYAAEIVFLCKKVDLINPKGNFGIVPDRFSAQIKLNPVGIFNKYKSTVVFGSKKYFINVNATDHEYIGVSSESNDDSVNHLIISRSSGESWLGFANMNKGYSYVMYAKCVKRQF